MIFLFALTSPASHSSASGSSSLKPSSSASSPGFVPKLCARRPATPSSFVACPDPLQAAKLSAASCFSRRCPGFKWMASAAPCASPRQLCSAGGTPSRASVRWELFSLLTHSTPGFHFGCICTAARCSAEPTRYLWESLPSSTLPEKCCLKPRLSWNQSLNRCHLNIGCSPVF